MNILVIAAHPDDEVLGCGGTISRLVSEGNRVFVAVLGEGITSRYESQQQISKTELIAIRKISKKVAAFLGVRSHFMLNLPDNRFDTIPILEIIKKIEKIIQRVSPDVIYTHHGGDLNIDHVLTFRATLTAARPKSGDKGKIYSFEIPSATEWAFQKFCPFFQPNTFVDIKDTLEKKIQAFMMYKSEVRTFPHPRSPEAIRARAHYWGSIAGVFAAEGFELIREIY